MGFNSGFKGLRVNYVNVRIKKAAPEYFIKILQCGNKRTIRIVGLMLKFT